MSSTLIPTCTFCGLRFASKPLLELHIHEDHLRRDNRAEPGQPGGHRQVSGLPEVAREVSTMTATPRRRRLRASRAMTALRRIARAIRHLNAELLLASEAMRRPVGVPRPGSRADMPAGSPERTDTAAGRAQRAA